MGHIFGHRTKNFVQAALALMATSCLLSTGLTINAAQAQTAATTTITTASTTSVSRAGTQITLQDLGTLQVAAHDLYNVNRITGIDSEDEILNLSTLFNYGQQNIANGGEIRNSENPITHTVAVNLGKYYQTQLKNRLSDTQAKQATIALYLGQLKIAYYHAFNQPFPKPEPESGPELNHFDGDLALRTLHAFIPGTIKLDTGNEVGVLDPSIASKILSKSELMQLSRPLSDTFDSSMRNITVFSTACNCMVTVDLFERDSSFATQFHTTYTFEQLMAQLADGKYDKLDLAYQEIADDMAADQPT